LKTKSTILVAGRGAAACFENLYVVQKQSFSKICSGIKAAG